ncbi:MAG: hypothetical protein NTY22_09915, partial [Proteobacteria bacterium]|nr:hypothetical protein [Pseudomonadota bacterium]
MISLVYFSLFFNLILAQSNINIPDDVEFIKIGDKLSSSTWGQGLRLLYPWIDQNFQNELQKGTSYETKGIVLNNKTEQTLNKKQRVVCFYLSDIKNTMLCLFQTMDVMMAVTGRAMLYAWANTDIKGETSLFYDNGDIDCNSGLANKV